MSITAPRGTQDILPTESYKLQFVERTLREASRLFGFNEIRTPTFEHIELFLRSVGDTTDVVQKEMYEVKAQKGKDTYALKPEGTAGVVRAALENGLLNDTLPLKVCYITPCFRHERPQAGRFREHHQFGCEVFGAASPAADAELISLISHVYKLLGLKDIVLNINSIGCPDCRTEYNKGLTQYFEQYKDKLCATCLERLYKNPMRILDCKSPQCGEIVANAPIMLDHLCTECHDHFEAVKNRLDLNDIAYTVNPKIVRGLDYYTKTVFEFVTTYIGAQGTVSGGGRYDGLVKQLGGKPTPGLGFGMGLERLLIVMEAQGIEIPKPASCGLYIGSIGEKANIKAGILAKNLRAEGFAVECDLLDRSVKAQMKYANKLNAQMSMILGDSELSTGKAKLKDMESGEEKEIEFDNDLMNILYDAMLAKEADKIAEQLGDNAFADLMGMDM